MVSYDIGKNFAEASNEFRKKIVIESKISDCVESITYENLSLRVERASFYLSSIGVKKGDRVSVVLENSPYWAVIFFALSYLGAIVVPLDPKFSHKDMSNIIDDAGVRFVVVSDKDDELREFLRTKDPVDKIISIESEELKDFKFNGSFKRAAVEPDDTMVILYTSGTTDLPKGVMLTHKNLCSNYDSLSKLNIFSHKEVILSVLPLYHSYAMMATFILPIFLGAQIVYVDQDWPEKLGEYIKTSKTTVFIGVPQIFQIMHSRVMKKLKEIEGVKAFVLRMGIKLGIIKIFGKRIRFFVSGGAKLDKTVAGDFINLGIKILEGYGLTETSPVTSLNSLKKPKAGSIGPPIPDVKMRIVKPDPEGIGEVAIKGPNVMKGYYKKQDKTDEVMSNGWFLSGDLGYEDNEGYFYITGRSKEIIVLSSGKNIYPEEIEKYYSESPYIKEMCVLGVVKEKGKAKHEYLHAVIVPDLEFLKSEGIMDTRKALITSFGEISKDLPNYKHIVGFTITKDSIPRTVLGKIKRYEVRNNFLPIILGENKKGSGDSKEDDLSKTKNAKKLINCIKDALEIKGDIGLNDSIELDLGVDSLTRVELLCAIERCFKIELSEEMIAGDIFTVKDVLLKIEEFMGGQKPDVSGGEKAVSWSSILKQPLADEYQNKISLKIDIIDHVINFFIKGGIVMFFRIFYKLQIKGVENIPERGPCILCANHTSYLDAFVVAAAVKFKTQLSLFYIAFRKYFKAPIIRNLIKRARVIPVDSSQIIEAMQASYFVLKQNKILCVFPEGERSIDGETKEFKKGVGIISRELSIPIVPVVIKGAFEAWPRTKKLPKFHSIKIVFGKPVFTDTLIREGMSKGARDDYDAISIALRDKVIKTS